ncbi:MAG: hypothetical protein ACHQQS_00095 [Thermoanaerobaculales bacterium]
MPGLDIYVEPRARVFDFFEPYPRVIVEISENTTTPEIKHAIATILAWRDGLVRTIGPKTTGLAAIQNLHLEFLLCLHEKRRLPYAQIAKRINNRLATMIKWAARYPIELWDLHRQQLLESIGRLQVVSGFRVCWNGHADLSRVPLVGRHSGGRRTPGSLRPARTAGTGYYEQFLRLTSPRPWNSREQRDAQFLGDLMAPQASAPENPGAPVSNTGTRSQDVALEEDRPFSMLASIRHALNEPAPVVSWESLMKSKFNPLDLPARRLMRMGFDGEEIEAFLQEAVANVLGGLEPFAGCRDTEYPVDEERVSNRIRGWRVGPVRKLLLERDPDLTVDQDPLERWEDSIMAPDEPEFLK